MKSKNTKEPVAKKVPESNVNAASHEDKDEQVKDHKADDLTVPPASKKTKK